MKKILVVALLIVCSSCSLWHSRGNSKIVSMSEARFSKYKTKEDVEKYFGKPKAVFVKDGFETYEYSYIYYGTRIWNMIPFVAIFMSAPSVEVSLLYVSFDNNGKIVGYYMDTKDGLYDEKHHKLYD